VPRCVVAIYAHPDDADVACGGSLARFAAEGAAVHLVIVADGAKGSSDPSARPSAIASARRDEVAAAAALMGVSSVEHLDVPDGELAEDRSLLGRLVELLRRHRPDLVIGHDPTATFFGSVYVNHRDHRAAGWAVLDAVAPMSGAPHYFPEAGAAHRVPELLLSGTLEPDCWIDISDYVETKVAAVACHLSQLSDEPSWAAETVRRRAAAEGRRIAVPFAEGFRRLELDG
jgi:LmbE family N-acetylglucosaminyl deacetylase